MDFNTGTPMTYRKPPFLGQYGQFNYDLTMKKCGCFSNETRRLDHENWCGLTIKYRVVETSEMLF